MVDTASVARQLRTDIERTGYYPTLVADSLATSVSGEDLIAYAVHHEATFDRDELRRHITVPALTATDSSSLMWMSTVDRWHQDPSTASASTEAVRLEKVDSVVVTRVVPDPATYSPSTNPIEVMLTIGWGAVSRIDLEPATCGDPSCEADHGFTGSSANDDLSLRVSAAADGSDGRQPVAGIRRGIVKGDRRNDFAELGWGCGYRSDVTWCVGLGVPSSDHRAGVTQREVLPTGESPLWGVGAGADGLAGGDSRA